jgi:hypothetical protein
VVVEVAGLATTIRIRGRATVVTSTISWWVATLIGDSLGRKR